MKAAIVFFFWTLQIIPVVAQEVNSDTISANYNGVSVLVRLKAENADIKNKFDLNVFRQNELGQEVSIYSLKEANHQTEWVYTDTLNLVDGIYVYRMELFAKNKRIASESVIVNRFTPGLFPAISNFKTFGDAGKQNITLKWKTIHHTRIRNLQLQRRNSLESEFSTIAVLSSTDSSFVDSVAVPNEAYFYRFQMLDRVSGDFFQSATVHYVPTFEIIPNAVQELKSDISGGFPKLEWQNFDEKSRGFYIFRLDPDVGYYQQISLLVTADSSQKYTWEDKDSRLALGATYNYYVVAESHSYTKGTPSDTVSVIIPSDSILLSPPQNLLFLKSLDEHYRLVWDADSTRLDEIAYFEIYRKKLEQSDFDTSFISQVPSYLNYLDIDMPLHGEEYAIRSGNGNNRSALSIPLTFHAVFQDNFGPTYLKAEILESKLWIKWNTPDDQRIQGFKLYKWDNNAFTEIEVIAGDQDMFKVENYKEGENNSFYITAFTKDGKESNPSKILTVF